VGDLVGASPDDRRPGRGVDASWFVAERLAAWREFAQGRMAHEIKNALSPIPDLGGDDPEEPPRRGMQELRAFVDESGGGRPARRCAGSATSSTMFSQFARHAGPEVIAQPLNPPVRRARPWLTQQQRATSAW
jgi:hypothetical protein